MQPSLTRAAERLQMCALLAIKALAAIIPAFCVNTHHAHSSEKAGELGKRSGLTAC